MPDRQPPGADVSEDSDDRIEGLGVRRSSHRFVVVVYGPARDESHGWPGHVVHASDAADADPAAQPRLSFDRIDQLPALMHGILERLPSAAKQKRRPS